MNCAEVAARFGVTDHCDSCHDEDEAGYGMCEVEIDGQWVSVCCKVAEAVRNDT